MKTFVFVFLQYITPQHTLSRIAGVLADCKVGWFKNFFITKFIDTYGVNMAEALDSTPENYPCFNEFFCRALKPEARPICTDADALTCPVDGAVSQRGKINAGRIFQAKGRDYSAQELLGGDENIAQAFTNGEFTTIYLSPKDYHRLHMPMAGKLISMSHVPGDLFSVNPATTDNVPRLFARNERLVCVFDTEIGPMALVLVGAMIVASIETTWAGLVAPVGKRVSTHNYGGPAPTFEKGEEFARFKLGSTIVMLFPENSIAWSETFQANSKVFMGERIAQVNDTTTENNNSSASSEH